MNILDTSSWCDNYGRGTFFYLQGDAKRSLEPAGKGQAGTTAHEPAVKPQISSHSTEVSILGLFM